MHPQPYSYGSSGLRPSIQLEHWRSIFQIVSGVADLFSFTYTLTSVFVAFYYGNLTHPSQDQPRVGLLSTVPSDAAQRLQAAVQLSNTTLGGNLPGPSPMVEYPPISLIYLQPFPRQRLPAFLHPPGQVLRVFLRFILSNHRFLIAPTKLQFVYDYLPSAS
jgi:hypothetical protein